MDREAVVKASIEALTPPEEREAARVRKSVEELRTALMKHVGQLPDAALLKDEVRKAMMLLPGVEDCVVLDPGVGDELTVQTTVRIATPVNMVHIEPVVAVDQELARREAAVKASIEALTPPEEVRFEPLQPQSIQPMLDDSTFQARHLKLWKKLGRK